MKNEAIKVLLIEDNPGDARLIQEMLAEAENGSRHVGAPVFDVECVNRLSAGLASLAANDFDVSLVDLGLPDSQGLDTFLDVHAQAPSTPIVVLTGLDDEVLGAETVQAGAQDYLVKGSVDSSLLTRAIAYAIRRHQLLSELQQKTQALRAGEAQLRKIIEQNADAMVVVDRDGAVRFVNPAAEDLFDRAADELVDSPFGFPTVTSDRVELDIVRGNGKTAVVEMRVVETEWEGEPAYLASLRDISERVRVEEELRGVNRALTVLSECNKAVVRAVEEPALLHDVCRIIVEAGGYRMAWVGFAQQDEAKTIRPVARAGVEQGYLETVQVTWADREHGRGPAGLAIRRGKPSIAQNILEDPKFAPWREEASKRGYASVIGLPLMTDGPAFGVLVIYATEPEAFDAQEVKLLTELADDLAYGITTLRTRAEHMQAEEQIRRLVAKFRAIAQPARQMSALLDVDMLVQKVVDALQEVTGCYNANLFLLEDDELTFAAGQGGYVDGQPPAGYRLPTDHGIIGQVAKTGEPWLVPDVSQDAHYVAWEGLPNTRSELAVPIKSGDRVLGVLDVQSTEPHGFDSIDVETLGILADQLAVALENARLYAAEQTRREALDALYALSRQLVASDELDTVLNTVARHAARITHVTFCRVLIQGEKDSFVCRAAHPTRFLEHDLGVGRADPELAQRRYRQILEAGEPVLLKQSEPEFSDEERHALLLDLAQTLCAAPLTIGPERIGLLVFGEARSEDREPFDAHKLRLTVAIADQAANAIHRATLHQQTERRLQRLASLREIDLTITSSLDLRVTLNVLIDQVISQLNVDAASLLLLDPHTQTLEYAAGRGFRSRAITRSHLRAGEGPAGRAVTERHVVHLQHLDEKDFGQRAPLLAAEQFVTYYGVPLIAKGHIKGVLEVFHRAPLESDSEWLNFLQTLAGQAAIAVDSASLFEDLQRSNMQLRLAYDTTLEGWSRALELRDLETEGHSKRVTEMTVRLARAMGMHDEELLHVRRGALLHDIGKMGIPDSILHKPGPLDDDEWEIMYQHPVLAYELLSPIAFLQPALDIPYYHHEKWDGTGYPRGLKGEAIPLPARIFAVVDVYDALRSNRPYRDAWPEEKVRAYIREQAGQHFDPQVVEAFFEMLEDVD